MREYKPANSQEFRLYLLKQSALLANVFDIDNDSIVTAISSDGGSPRRTLLQAIVDDSQTKAGRDWWSKAAHVETKELIARCFRLLRRHSTGLELEPNDAEHFDTIREALAVLGVGDVDSYPLIRLKSPKQLDLAALSEALNRSIEWVDVIQDLLTDAFHQDILLSNSQRFGILCIWLVLGCGVSSKGELSITLAELQCGRIRSHKGHLWTSCTYEKRRGERRRQWLTTETVLLSQSIDWSDERCQLAIHSHAIRDALKTVRTLSPKLKDLKQTNLLAAGLARGFFLARLPVFVIGYMRGEISSSSLSEASLARNLGCSIAPIDHAPEADPEREIDGRRSSLAEPTEQAVIGISTMPVRRGSIISELSRTLSRSDIAAKKDAQKLIKATLAADLPPLIRQILCWVDQQLVPNAPRTVKSNLDHVHAQLIPVVDGLEAIDDPDQWASYLEEITADLSERSKALSALSSFAHFLTETYGEEFEGAGRTALSGINAQCVSINEVTRALTLLERSLDPGRFKVARVIVEQALGAGLRRSEVDGLLTTDIELGSVPAIKIRKNNFRTLKTCNAKRHIPLHLVEAMHKGHIERVRELSTNTVKNELLYKQHGHIPLNPGEDKLFLEITKALQAVSGDPKLKFHSLRHTFCCNLLCALMYDQTNLSALASFLPQLEDVQLLTRFLPSILGDAGTRERFELAAVRTMLGHLQESTTLLHYFHWMDVMRFAGFCRPEATLTLRESARRGAAGIIQNSSGDGSRLHSGNSWLEKRIAVATHALGTYKEHAVDLLITVIAQSQDIRESLDICMQLGRTVSSGGQIQTVTLPNFGTLTQADVTTATTWIHSTFIAGSYGRYTPDPLSQRKNAGAIDCLTHALHSLSLMAPDAVQQMAKDLCWLAATRCEPYLTYRLHHIDELLRAITALRALLPNYPIIFDIEERRLGCKRYEALPSDFSIEDLQLRLGEPDTAYKLCLHRGASQFPHRAITWLTCALRLASAGYGVITS